MVVDNFGSRKRTMWVGAPLPRIRLQRSASSTASFQVSGWISNEEILIARTALQLHCTHDQTLGVGQGFRWLVSQVESDVVRSVAQSVLPQDPSATKESETPGTESQKESETRETESESQSTWPVERDGHTRRAPRQLLESTVEILIRPEMCLELQYRKSTAP